MRELFIYYRVPARHAGVARAAIQAMQDRLRSANLGLEARWLVRSASAASDETWMETYARPGAAGGVDLALEERIEAAALPWADLRDGERHVEAFTTGA